MRIHQTVDSVPDHQVMKPGRAHCPRCARKPAITGTIDHTWGDEVNLRYRTHRADPAKPATCELSGWRVDLVHVIEMPQAEVGEIGEKSRALQHPHPVGYADDLHPEEPEPVAARLNLHLVCDHNIHPHAVQMLRADALYEWHIDEHEETRLELSVAQAAERVIDVRRSQREYGIPPEVMNEAIDKLAKAVRQFRMHTRAERDDT